MTMEHAPAYPIASVDNALSLLRLIAQRQTLRLTDVSRLLDIAPSTAHRLLAMLALHGFVQRDPDTRAYLVGPGLLDPCVGDAATTLTARARDVLRALTRQLGETSHVCILQGTNVLFVDSVESDRSPRIGSRQGVRLPAHCTSAGKALLAQLPLEVVATLYGERPLVALAPASIADLRGLEVEHADVRRRGWAANNGESEADVRAVAVATRTSPIGVPVAIAVAAPHQRMSPERMQEIVPMIRRAAEVLTDAAP